MIQSITGIRPGVIPNIIRIRREPGRLLVPVRPINTIYSHFKHVRGVPSIEGGVPVVKLRILDTLIDRLLSSKGKAPELARADTENIDQQIEQLRRQLNAMALSTGHFYRGSFFPEEGTLINMVA